MTQNSQKELPQKNSKEIVTMLIDDLKETGEHLRETDKKVSFVVQLYGGFFVILATVVAALLQAQVSLGLFEGLLGLVSVSFFAALTWWLFIFTLRSRETKKRYINRMNFLRREIHILLENQYADHLDGYWTKPVRERDTSEVKKSFIQPVGLDDLYPIGLAVIVITLGFLFSLLLSQQDEFTDLVQTYFPITVMGKEYPSLVIQLTTFFVLFNLVWSKWRESNKKIEERIAKLSLSRKDIELNSIRENNNGNAD